jgi:hypothetical protein
VHRVIGKIVILLELHQPNWTLSVMVAALGLEGPADGPESPVALSDCLTSSVLLLVELAYVLSLGRFLLGPSYSFRGC